MNLFLKDYISIKIHQTDLILTSCVKARLEPYNLAPEQNLIMMLLWEKDGLTQNQIAETLGKDKTNIARMAANLESKGFIRRTGCPNDRRSLKLYLSPEGKALSEQVVPTLEGFNDLICKGITKEEIVFLETILSKFNQNVQKCNE
ncbi:MAG: MarR family winged helix-turn-helix transcriptional regulator [Bacillus sp. (in: firmicutes)]